MAETPDFQQKQYAFAAHIRDPENNPAPADIEDRRMGVYRELFFNNLLQLLSSTFPVLAKLHSREKWRSFIRQFMVSHEAQTPYFLEIPKEFLAFLENEYERSDDDYPFLMELAHYEWAELALSVSEESNNEETVDSDGDFLQGIPVKSKLAWLFSYHFPVHRISKSFKPKTADEQPTFIVIYRDRSDDMGFMELNPVTARLLERIGENSALTGRALLEALAAEINYPDAAALIEHGDAAMKEMHAAEILTGTRSRT